MGTSDHFKEIGTPAFSAFANFARGTSARDGTSGASLPNRQEIDATIDYHLPGGKLEEVWLRLRYAYLDEDGDSGAAHDLRLILNYQIPIL